MATRPTADRTLPEPAMPAVGPALSAAVRTVGLTRRFEHLVAVDHLDLEVRHGEVFGLLGRNGAGKTTTIKMLITLLEPTEGTATVGGYDIRTDPARVRRVIGYVPQLLSADGSLTAWENLMVFARLYHIPRSGRRDRVSDALAFMGLDQAAHTLVRDFSGGMIRRDEVADSEEAYDRVGRLEATGETPHRDIDPGPDDGGEQQRIDPPTIEAEPCVSVGEQADLNEHFDGSEQKDRRGHEGDRHRGGVQGRSAAHVPTL
jgi:ABC transporter